MLVKDMGIVPVIFYKLLVFCAIGLRLAADGSAAASGDYSPSFSPVALTSNLPSSVAPDGNVESNFSKSKLALPPTSFPLPPQGAPSVSGAFSPVAQPPSDKFRPSKTKEQKVVTPATSPAPAPGLPPVKQFPIGPATFPSASPPRSFPRTPPPMLPPTIDSVSPGPHITQAPVTSPGSSPSPSPSALHQPPTLLFPPPPPSEDCSSTICTEPYTNSPGSQCACVLPMHIGLRLGVDLYTFFPLVSEFASEIAAGVNLKQSQVRIMGANSASQELGKTVVLVNLVPLGAGFDNSTSYLTSERFWHKEVPINSYFFGGYDVLYIHYPGLLPSPSTPSSANIIDGSSYSDENNNAMETKPLGVDVIRKHKKKKILSHGVIAAISLCSLVGILLLGAITLAFLIRKRRKIPPSETSQRSLYPFITKPSATSTSMSFGPNIAAYTGSARTFSTGDIIKATNNFDKTRILGEGGFGLVYSGLIDDHFPVALKVLKRDDQQSGREFFAEVEMLSRLHHRNLVKLIGICTEEGARCLVYELIPNGSVESHLHGVHKNSSPMNWDTRIRIALGAARGLAYLHEDSNPRVIHRDFKSSNILLEQDFTPKVSDFGLARTALDEESKHISTRVMGTFGYVAPEYAMTGHLLVKSDVYSYGVVLLELLTGRKPVNMSQPPGQENLVSWARPLLSNSEGLQEILDPSLRPDVPFDSVAKVAAIASMCVQPEVSHRPFMGEVVQALKLVCNECDDAKDTVSATLRSPASDDPNERSTNPFQDTNVYPGYDSEPDIERGLPLSDLFFTSCKRNSFSGPLLCGKTRNPWSKLRRSRRESVSEHGIMLKFWSYSH